jgi:hypothetical protein
MYAKFERADDLSRLAIGAAIEVHRAMGSGLRESIYEKCLIRSAKPASMDSVRFTQRCGEHSGLQARLNGKNAKRHRPI